LQQQEQEQERRQELQQVRRDYEDRIEALERRLREIEVAQTAAVQQAEHLAATVATNRARLDALQHIRYYQGIARHIRENLPDICASVQHRIVSILLNKLKKATIQTGIRRVCLAGGVSANSGLRKEYLAHGEKYGWQTFIPAFEYCTDNAGMIAIAAYYKYLENDFVPLSASPTARAEW
jgi:tRNA A37 threonylcarbamoyltransferase TsaD